MTAGRGYVSFREGILWVLNTGSQWIMKVKTKSMIKLVMKLPL